MSRLASKSSRVNTPVVVRKSHKWITLIIGIQALLWMLSGAYMATVDIDFIHGDSLVRNTNELLTIGKESLYPMQDVLRRFPDATAVDVVAREGSPFYVISSAGKKVLLDATNGVQRSPMMRENIVRLAGHYYAGEGEIVSIRLLSDPASKPSEIQTRPLPLWQVEFDDGINTAFYLSPSTGELITRRHTFWRAYDFLWMLHIMDYQDRSDINNNLLRVAASVGLIMAVSGIWLLIFSLRRVRPNPDQSAGGPAPHGSFSDSVSQTT